MREVVLGRGQRTRKIVYAQILGQKLGRAQYMQLSNANITRHRSTHQGAGYLLGT